MFLFPIPVNMSDSPPIIRWSRLPGRMSILLTLIFPILREGLIWFPVFPAIERMVLPILPC